MRIKSTNCVLLFHIKYTKQIQAFKDRSESVNDGKSFTPTVKYWKWKCPFKYVFDGIKQKMDAL